MKIDSVGYMTDDPPRFGSQRLRIIMLLHRRWRRVIVHVAVQVAHLDAVVAIVNDFAGCCCCFWNWLFFIFLTPTVNIKTK